MTGPQQSCFTPGMTIRAGLVWEHHCVYRTEKSLGVHVPGPHTETQMCFLLHQAEPACALKSSFPYCNGDPSLIPLHHTTLLCFYITSFFLLHPQTACGLRTVFVTRYDFCDASTLTAAVPSQKFFLVSSHFLHLLVFGDTTLCSVLLNPVWLTDPVKHG